MHAVLVIDMLKDFFEDGWLHDIRSTLTGHVNQLIAEARRAEVPVVWVRQAFRDDLSDAFRAMRERDIRVTIDGTEGARILPELDRRADDAEIVKKRYSGFYETRLDTLLADLDAAHLILAGVNTHACIRTTAIDAYQRDLEVTIPRECVASNDREHHDVTLRYLAREIATVASLGDVLTRLRPASAERDL